MTITLLSVGISLLGLGAIFNNFTIRSLRKRISNLEAVITDARPDLLVSLPAAPKVTYLPTQDPVPVKDNRKRCGLDNCQNFVAPNCPAKSCAKCCKKFCNYYH